MAISLRLAAVLVGCLLGTHIGHGSQISGSPAYYPRLTLVNGSTAVAVAEKPSGNVAQLVFFARTSLAPSEAWTAVSVIVSDSSPGVDLANGFLHQLDDGTLLCAYRHHTGSGSSRVYRIALSASVDGGATWTVRSNITVGATGVWEPFLYRSSGKASVLHVLYSAELTNGGEQDVVQQDSLDGGVTWTAVTARVHTAGSRNGMPGVVEVRDGSLVMVMEGFWTGVWGHFTVNSVRSFDGGYTWSQPSIVYAPSVDSGYNAGSPQIGACNSPGADYKLCAVFMCNQPMNGSSAARAAWPDGAQIWVQEAHIDVYNESMPFNWTQGHPAVVPTTTATAYWPSLLLDIVNDLGSLRVAYQADDGSAQLNGGTLCLN